MFEEKYASIPLILMVLVCSGYLHGQERYDKYALLVGVAKYQDANMNRNPLKFPENDAEALKKLLEGSGYQVDLLVHKSATRKAVTEALRKTAKQGTADGAVLVGFFGHGVQYDEIGYFCPYDTSLRELTDSKGNVIRDKTGAPKLEPDPKSLVSMRLMLDALSACGAKNRVLLADCCRDDPNRARGRTAFGSSFQAKNLPPGTAAFFACQKGEQAYEHDEWEHGAFTFAFLKHANELAATGPVTSGTLSDKIYVTVRQIVKEKTGRPQQTVYCLNSGRVNFMLKPPSADRMAARPTKANPDPKNVAPATKTFDVYETNHAGAGAELIAKPDNRILLKELFSPKAERLVNGSEVIIEEIADCESGGPLKWARIRVLNGPAKGKTGWTGMRNLKLTDKKITGDDLG